MKIKIFEPPLPSLDVEQMSNGGEVTPRRMFEGGDVDPERIAQYLANNPIISETAIDNTPPLEQQFTSRIPDVRIEAATGLAPIQQTTGGAPDASFDPYYMYGPSASERLGFNVEQGAYGNDYAQYDPMDYVRSQNPGGNNNNNNNNDNNNNNNDNNNNTDGSGETEAERIARELAELNRRLSAGELSIEEIQGLISGGLLTEDQVLSLIGNYELTEDQLAQLYSQGLLTEEQILEIVEGRVDELENEEDAESLSGLTQEQIQDLIDEGRLTEDQVLDLISTELGDYDPNLDLSGYATTDDLSGYATTEQVQGLENLFQNYLTPEQLQAYLPQEGQYVTPDQLAAATSNEYDTVIQGLTEKLGELEEKYSDVTSQYEADAVNQQISDTKDEINTFFNSAPPSGPRTGSTSQFSSGTSFLPGGSPMASLIEGQRAGQGSDPFTSYLKTFTPSYSSYNEPFSPQEYNDRNLPFTGGMYNNPFTGGMSYNPDKRSMGGQVSNGIMDLTNFDTNVQPFQNAFRPNVPRN